jgi:fatty acid elongase 2/fatty acid elongase 3
MGEEYAAGFGVFIISSYLLLFISFYLTTYKTQAPRLYSQASRALGPKKEKGL